MLRFGDQEKTWGFPITISDVRLLRVWLILQRGGLIKLQSNSWGIDRSKFSRI